MSAKRYLPEYLWDAYNWTAAAGELDELATLTGFALVQYAHRSERNAREHEEKVSASDLQELAERLRHRASAGLPL